MSLGVVGHKSAGRARLLGGDLVGSQVGCAIGRIIRLLVNTARVKGRVMAPFSRGPGARRIAPQMAKLMMIFNRRAIVRRRGALEEALADLVEDLLDGAELLRLSCSPPREAGDRLGRDLRPLSRNSGPRVMMGDEGAGVTLASAWTKLIRVTLIFATSDPILLPSLSAAQRLVGGERR